MMDSLTVLRSVLALIAFVLSGISLIIFYATGCSNPTIQEDGCQAYVSMSLWGLALILLLISMVIRCVQKHR